MSRHNLDDQWIANQVSGLSDLPHGYSPNLQSKWELIETSLTEQHRSKRLVVLAWRIAASILLLAGVFVLLKPTAAAPELQSAGSTANKLVKPETTPLPTAQTLPVVNAPTIKKQREPLVTQHVTPVIVAEEPVVPPEALEVVTNETVPLKETVSIAKKKSKRRFEQLDFGDPVVVPATATEVASGLHIKLRPLSTTNTMVSTQQKNPIAIRIPF